jgi:hypothetical protein
MAFNVTDLVMTIDIGKDRNTADIKLDPGSTMKPILGRIALCGKTNFPGPMNPGGPHFAAHVGGIQEFNDLKKQLQQLLDGLNALQPAAAPPVPKPPKPPKRKQT